MKLTSLVKMKDHNAFHSSGFVTENLNAWMAAMSQKTYASILAYVVEILQIQVAFCTLPSTLTIIQIMQTASTLSHSPLAL